jgi:threonine dehydrogenase-like Zn-dependent dehydrogenase
VTDILDHRLDFIKRFGATDTINTQDMPDHEIVQATRDITGGFGVDSAMEVAGIPSLIPLGLKCLRKGGCYIEIGCSFPDADFVLDASDIVWNRLTIKGIHNYDAKHLQMAVDFIEMTRQVFPFSDIVSRRVNLDDITAGMRMSASGREIRVAVLP